tara:strand:+ start:11266 stop:13989 length:2724 start_codon:yes stop_codon:yes gene_type:complete
MPENNLNLPKTAFSMKANLPSKEPKILDNWNKSKLYEKLRKKSSGKEKFILHDGPPYANGHIHMGTALNKILKDIVTKFHQMNNKDSVYVPGWDCHGLPIEWKIEEQYKKKKKNKDEVPTKDFRKECREFAEKWIDIHKKEFKRLGVIGDWDNYYSTMSFDAEAQIVRELGKFLLEGSLYRGFKPVLWSTVEKTALADAEVEYKDHKSNTIYAEFKIKKTDKDFLKDSSVVIWTTTPWTIPANKALAYNKGINYSILEIDNKKKIIVAEKLVNSVMEECEINKFKVLKSFKGDIFKNIICSHPFKNLGYGYDVPMFEADFVTLEQGTGIVHCAPSHGPDDFNLCLKHGMKAIETVNNDGRYTKNIPIFEGTHVFKADEIIVKNLKDQNNLLGSGTLVHSYPHSWRSKAPLVHRATPQWFISMESHKLRKKALESIDKTDFYPEKGKERIRAMIETRPDWCISRQRSWGVPLPIFVNKKTNEPLRDSNVVENIAKIYEKEGSDCWFYDDPQRFLGKKYKKEDYIKSNDIVEVWFDSGSTHSFVLEKRKDLKWPASMYLEGSDQHRGWFHSSLLESCGTRDRAPFDSILSHGFVVDGKGMKMSKSAGNIISPEEILKKYGADILRLWVSSSDYAEDLRIDHSILEQHAESYRKIRNTFRFLLGNLRDNFMPKDFQEIKYKSFPDLEKLILHKLFILNKDIMNNFKKYNFHKLQKDLLNFCSLDLSSFYFDIRKDVLYCDDVNSEKRKSCIDLLNIVLECLMKWYAPVLSFTTEEINDLAKKNRKNSIHEENFPDIPSQWKNEDLYKKWEKLLALRQKVNIAIEEKRSSKIIGSSLEADVEITLPKSEFDLLKEVDPKELFITSHVDQKISKANEINVIVKKAKGTKCDRCWKIVKETKNNKCSRCLKIK